MQPQLRPWVQWAQDGAAATQNMWFQGPTSRATSRTKNMAIPGAIRMVLHSLDGAVFPGHLLAELLWRPTWVAPYSGQFQVSKSEPQMVGFYPS